MTRQVKTPCRVGRAAELLGKSIDATYQDVARRRIPFRRLGRTVLFFEEELVDFLDARPGLRLEDLIPKSSETTTTGAVPQ